MEILTAFLLYVIRLGVSYNVLKSFSQYSNFQMFSNDILRARIDTKSVTEKTQPTISWKVVTHYATSLTKSRNFCYVMLVVYRTYLIGFTRSQKVVTRCGTSAKVVDQMPPE